MESSFTWEEILHWLAGPGVAVAVGLVISELTEYVPQYNLLTPRLKRLVFFILCLVVPAVSSFVGILTCAWPYSWSATIWPALVAGVMAFGTGTLAHTRELKDWRVEIQALTAQVAEARAMRVFGSCEDKEAAGQ